MHTYLDEVIHQHLNQTFPALSLVVIKDGITRMDGAWGWIDPEVHALPVQPDTRFDLASLSKLFTVTAFLSLVSEGQIDLDDPLITVIPEFGASGPRPLDGGIDPHSKAHLPVSDEIRDQVADPAQVTFRHLLTHTSGLAPWRDVYRAAGPAPAPPDQIDPIPREIRWGKALEALCNYPFVGQPGDGVVRYSDLGLMLLGETVSRLDRAPLETVIQKRVFDPLQLTSLTYNPLQNGATRLTVAPTEYDPTWRERRCWGEVHDENACGVGGVAGHAGLFGTARDVAGLGQAWLESDSRLKINSALVSEAKKEHAVTGDMRRGLGWMLKSPQNASAGDLFSLDTYGHTGFTGTSLWIDPQRALVVACLTNSVYMGRLRPDTHIFRRAIHDAIVQGVEHL